MAFAPLPSVLSLADWNILLNSTEYLISLLNALQWIHILLRKSQSPPPLFSFSPCFSLTGLLGAVHLIVQADFHFRAFSLDVAYTWKTILPHFLPSSCCSASAPSHPSELYPRHSFWTILYKIAISPTPSTLCTPALLYCFLYMSPFNIFAIYVFCLLFVSSLKWKLHRAGMLVFPLLHLLCPEQCLTHQLLLYCHSLLLWMINILLLNYKKDV